MNRNFVMTLVLAAAVVACKEQPKPEPAPTPVVPAQPAAAAAPVITNVNANVESAALDNIPVQEDFDEQARGAITTENLDTEIESLEREVAE